MAHPGHEAECPRDERRQLQPRGGLEDARELDLQEHCGLGEEDDGDGDVVATEEELLRGGDGGGRRELEREARDDGDGEEEADVVHH